MQTFDTINYTGEIAGGVVIATVPFANDERKGFVLTIGETRRKHHLCTVAGDQQFCCAEPFDNFGEQIVVDTFAAQVAGLKTHIKFFINSCKIMCALGHEQFPESQRVLVAALQRHHAGAGTLLKFGRRFKLGACLFIKTVQVAHRQFTGRTNFAEVHQVFDQHAEWRAPIADVVLANHTVPDGFTHTHQGVTDDS